MNNTTIDAPFARYVFAGGCCEEGADDLELEPTIETCPDCERPAHRCECDHLDTPRFGEYHPPHTGARS